MSQTSYDYENRSGIVPISWEDFHGLCKALAVAAYAFQPEIILAVGRGGFYPGTLVAHILQVELYPVRLSRRVNDIATYQTPQWLVEPPPLVAGKRVLIVDEISSTGETLTLVKQKIASLGAAEVKVAVLYAHSWGVDVPDYIGLISDSLLLNPWDREVLRADGFQFHPEYAEALAHQGIQPDSALLIQTPQFEVVKGYE